MRGLLGGTGWVGDRLRVRRLRLCWLLVIGVAEPDSLHAERVDEFARALALCGAPPEERAN